VQREAYDQDRRQADLACSRGDPDGQALGEVVQPDRGGDGQAGLQRPGLGRAGLRPEALIILGGQRVAQIAVLLTESPADAVARPGTRERMGAMIVAM
jgi:hypothetical protein